MDTQEQKIVFSNKKEIEKVVIEKLEKEKEKIKEELKENMKWLKITKKEFEILALKYILENYDNFESFVLDNIEKLYRDINIEIETKTLGWVEYIDRFVIYLKLDLPRKIDVREIYNTGRLVDELYLYPVVEIPISNYTYETVLYKNEKNIYFVEIRKDVLEKYNILNEFKETYKSDNKIIIKLKRLEIDKSCFRKTFYI